MATRKFRRNKAGLYLHFSGANAHAPIAKIHAPSQFLGGTRVSTSEALSQCQLSQKLLRETSERSSHWLTATRYHDFVVSLPISAFHFSCGYNQMTIEQTKTRK
jgi:hypothetical protein